MENGALFEKWIFIGMESKNYLRRIYSRHLYRTRQTFVLNEICEDLEREGYTVETFIIPACSVEAWHRRDRIWIIAYDESQFNREHLRGKGKGQIQQSGKRVEQTSVSIGNNPDTSCSDTHRTGSHRKRKHEQRETELRDEQKRELGSMGEDVSNSDTRFSKQQKGKIQTRGDSADNGGKDVSNTQSQRLQKPTIKESQQGTPRTGFECGNLQPRGETEYWSTEPNVGGMASRIPKELAGYWDREPDIPRVAKGVKDRVNKLKALGNAVVPQIPYEIFLAIQKIEDEKQT